MYEDLVVPLAAVWVVGTILMVPRLLQILALVAEAVVVTVIVLDAPVAMVVQE